MSVFAVIDVGVRYVVCALIITNLIIDLFEGAFRIGLRSWHIITLVNDVYYHQDIISYMAMINGSTSR